MAYFDSNVSFMEVELDRFMFLAISRKFASMHLLPFARSRHTTSVVLVRVYVNVPLIRVLLRAPLVRITLTGTRTGIRVSDVS